VTTPTLSALHDLHGRVAVVTGAASGIGRAAAHRLAEAGAAVVCADLDGEAAGKMAGELVSAYHGAQATSLSVDVREPEQLAAMATQAVDDCGRVDILVNSAGVFPPAPMLQMSSSQWDAVLDINTKGTFLASQACAPHMQRTAGGGTIVNIASKSAFQPTRGMSHYAASKGAIVMLTKALALELSPLGIRVNAVAPGGVDTPGAAATGEAMRSHADEFGSKSADFGARCPMGRSADADEIARVILFLATDWSSYMTGSTVLADGGYLLT
jgi:2-deoxy-D-gluconate 3-dehydrogenase